MYNHILYFAYWLFDSLTIFVFGLLFPSQVVLGNWRFSPIEASIYAGFWMTFFIWSLWDFAIAKGVKFDSGIVTFGYFGLSNIFAVWIVSRLSQFAGFGVSSYFWTISIGLTIYLMQRFVWRIVVKK